MQDSEIRAVVEQLCQEAAGAKYAVQALSTEEKNQALRRAAVLLREQTDVILEANDQDLAAAAENHMREVMMDRLRLTPDRIDQMALGLEQVADLPDPLGEELDEFVRPNGMKIRKVRVPIGVIGIIYESRPNVTADAFALCFKSGNVSVLKGGSDAIITNRAISRILKQALTECGIPEAAVNLIDIPSRQAAAEFMKMRDYVDIMIPRGSAGLIRTVVENSRIPVIETGAGNCMIYVDKEADLKKAIPIILNAKTQRVSVCNAAESLVVHQDIRDAFLPLLSEAMKDRVELRADEQAIGYLPGAVPASEEDFGKEYLDYILSVKTVASAQEAIDHINRYHTGHSDCIITENAQTAQAFLKQIDAACVYVNVSTRFTDGFEFGFGAEIGISTQKLHARGPMGLKELTSYKYLIEGDGQVRG
ncbi:MAG: glutamate-5-semialdehyde dehydrogenase [Lachnospiraceae bacterium]|nr:glutamate-5-semialdehyde dehydrogenase [Lachnospiraceae bacterium]